MKEAKRVELIDLLGDLQRSKEIGKRVKEQLSKKGDTARRWTTTTNQLDPSFNRSATAVVSSNWSVWSVWRNG